MNPVETVRTFWERMQLRDWDGVRAMLAEDVLVEWPVTNESFVGAEHVVAVNAEYPEGWDIQVVRLVGSDSLVVAEVEVPQDGVGVFRTAAFMEVVDGRIARSVEYWVELAGEEPPAWRRSLAERFGT